MAGNEVVLTYAGDASSAERAGEQVEQSMTEVGQAARQMSGSIGSSEDAFESAGRASGRFGEALDRANGASSILSGGIGDIGGAMTAFTDLQSLGATKALEHEKALLAVEQAETDYAEAVKEFGVNSLEARGAQLALTEAQQAAEPPSKIAEWGEKLELLSPIIMAVVGATDLMILANTIAQASWIRTAASMVVARTAMVASSVATGVATAAQWLWNAAMTANPIGLVVLAIALLVAGIVWVATKTTWFQTIWEAVWGAIVAYFNWVKGNYETVIGAIVAGAKWVADKIGAVPGLIKSAFSGLFNIITAPWRAAFNFIADAWNNTIGRLSWTVPSWVPFVGGNSISAPRLPKFHAGGVVPGAPGSEMLGVLQAGETITPAGQSSRTVIEIRSGGTQWDDLLVEVLASAIRRNGGLDVVLGGRSG